MKKKNRGTLFSRLMISVALPEIVIFGIVAIISYIQLKDLFHEISEEKIENLQSELASIISFQEVSLGQMSRNIDHNAQQKMKKLRFEYFLTSDSIETADLERIRKEIGMKESDDIYVINREGTVVNTTFKNDLNFNLFSLGSEFQEFIEDIFYHNLYVPQAMSLETNTRRFKKYIYQSSKDQEYILQLGFYSTEAERFNDEIGKRLKEIEKSPNDIESIDFIMAPIDPFSLYTGRDVSENERSVVDQIFKNKKNLILDEDSVSISYIYFERLDSEAVSWEGILKVIYDKKKNREILLKNLIQKISLFGFGMILLFIILFINVKAIIKPIHSLSSAARKLGDGELDQRSDLSGTREMMFLSESFNQMADNLEASHKEITRKNEEIMASINYAKRIQEAIMPPYNEIHQFLDEHFILYKPKDVVAGDFYWFEVIDDIIYIAAADCTGHGVPGAMVSVVCSNSLNRAVKELGLTEPSKILDTVRDLVIETFEKSQHDVKDGMDICFCRINMKNREVVYSGAENNLYRITKKNEVIEDSKTIFDESHMLVEYKADKMPIGKFTINKPFKQERIQCEKGDYIYLFTDGYADQFGGPDGRKFMYKPFKKLLLSFYGKDMQEQKNELNSTFENWRGSESQIDDVCIIGIRIT